MRVSDLTKAQLDYWVAKAEGKHFQHYAPSTNWHQGGPIIEREKIVVGPWMGKGWAGTVEAYPESAAEVGAFGATYLEAAMRAYVASKFGKEVDECTPYR